MRSVLVAILMLPILFAACASRHARRTGFVPGGAPPVLVIQPGPSNREQKELDNARSRYRQAESDYQKAESDLKKEQEELKKQQQQQEEQKSRKGR